MKLRVLRNSMRGRQMVGLIIGGLFGLAFALLTMLTGLSRFGGPATTVDLLAALYAGWLVGWVLAPVATGGGDETLRPEHFALLPIGKRQLATGLLAASFAGVPAVVSLVAFLGLFLYGLTFGAGAAVVGLLFAVLQLALVVLTGRLVMAALGALLTSRKGKDLGILLVALTGLSGVGVNYVLSSLGPAIIDGRVPEFAAVVTIMPSGWGAVAVHEAGAGNWIMVGLLLTAMVALLAFLLAGWGVLLVKRTTNTSFRGSSRSASHNSSAKTDGPKRRFLLPDTPVGAVARKELRTWWRDARRRVALLSTLIIGVVITVAPALSGGSPRTLPFISVLVVFFSCLQAGNLYGFDGSALWHTLVIPGAERADVRGRQLGWALIVGPIGLVLAAVVPGVTSSSFAYPWVFGLLPAGLGAGAGVLLLQSVLVAFPLPDARRNSSPFASGGRPGCARILLQLSIMLLLVVAALPVIAVEVAGTIAHLPVLRWAGVPVGIVTGAVLAWWWGRIALNRLIRRGPELLATVSKER
jgi:ABC-2 type transport system permease protein